MLFKEKRERLHRAIRLGSQIQIEEMLQAGNNECVMLAIAKSNRSRCSLHIAVLSQHEGIVRFLAENFPTTLDVLDNVRRNNVSSIEPSDLKRIRVLIKFNENKTIYDETIFG